MLEKWERQPQRVGMLLGFVALPLGWFLQEWLLSQIISFRSPSNFQLINYFATGAIPGTILGAGVSKAAFAARHNNWGDAKWNLLVHSGFVLLVSLLLLIPSGGRNPLRFLLTFFPLHLSVLMLLIGLLMHSRR